MVFQSDTSKKSGSTSRKSNEGKATLTQLLGMPIKETFDDSGSSASKHESALPEPSTATKQENLFGCDWLDELSITIRKNRTTPIYNPRLSIYSLFVNPACLSFNEDNVLFM